MKMEYSFFQFLIYPSCLWMGFVCWPFRQNDVPFKFPTKTNVHKYQGSTMSNTWDYERDGNPDEYGPYFEGDIRRSPKNRLPAVINDNSKLWPDGIIPYEISKDIDTAGENDINQAIKEFETKTCVKWVKRTDIFLRNYVVFVNKTGGYWTSTTGCWSDVGMMGGKQEISLGKGCTSRLGVLIHEMMHALGFWHEHSRFDRDNYVIIKWQNIKPDVETNFDKHILLNTQYIAPYDYGSLMHYSRRAFSRNDQDTIRPIVGWVEIGQRWGFSEVDLYEIRRLYKCPEWDLSKFPKVVAPPAPETITKSLPYLCDFEEDYCGFYQEFFSEQTDWSRRMGRTPSDGTGPSADHTTGGGVYAYVEASDPFASPYYRATLYSAKFASSGSYCLRFYYHMNGKDMGSLRVVEIKDLSSNGLHTELKNETLAKIGGHKGDKWHMFNITRFSVGTLRIAFEGTVGASFRSDLAIDDIQIINGNCERERELTTQRTNPDNKQQTEGLSIEWQIVIGVSVGAVVLALAIIIPLVIAKII